MIDQEKKWFDALTKDRYESATMLEKPSMRGVQRSVVDKYSDQAHFIYELLQNADDVKATSARFCLNDTGLAFVHNGTVRFTVSDPQNEASDSESGALGHINSITSIANSNKTSASIGKFGVGFKAVFQYTQTPHIYDPNVRFKIDRFIVPHPLDADFSGRKESETAFWFPFDHKVKTSAESTEDILLKLKALDHPVLFLSHLKRISFEANGVTGTYTKEVEESCQHEDIKVERLVLTLETNGKSTTDRLLSLTRLGANQLPYCVGFGLNAEGRLKPVDRPAFCFFPTKEDTNLRFIVHAPFLLTDSREGIKAGEKHNQDLVQKLSQLAADSLPILRDQGLIDDGLLEIIPYDESRFAPLDDRRELSFKPFFSAIKSKLQNDALLPAADGECSAKSRSYWASDTELVGLFSDQQLATLTGKEGSRWIFRTRGKKEVQNANRALADYIDGGDGRDWMRRESNLIVASFDPEGVLRRLTSGFIAEQSHEWLHRLYRYLSERSSYQEIIKDKPIFIDNDGKAVPAFDENKQLVLFLPDSDIEGYTTVHPDLLANKATREFIEKVGIKKPSLRDEIYNRILPAYADKGEIDTDSHFIKFYRYFKECKNENVVEFVELIKDKEFLSYMTEDSADVFRGKASDIYSPTHVLKAWFEPKSDTRFLDLKVYHAIVGENERAILDDFLKQLGINYIPKVLSRHFTSWPHAQNLRSSGHTHCFEDKLLDGCEELLSDIDPGRSALLWQVLATQIQVADLRGRHTWSYYGPNSPW